VKKKKKEGMKERKKIRRKRKERRRERKKYVFQGIGYHIFFDLRAYPFSGITHLSVPQPFP
jgi:hypothetical protein